MAIVVNIDGNNGVRFRQQSRSVPLDKFPCTFAEEKANMGAYGRVGI